MVLGMKQTPKVTITSQQKALRVPRKQIERLVDLMSRREQRIALADIAFVEADASAEANRRFLSHAGATDVISFDLSDETSTGLVVQLIICGPVTVRQAADHGEPAAREALRYVAHGLLHQMGYDDGDPRSAARMHAREDELLDELKHAGAAR